MSDQNAGQPTQGDPSQQRPAQEQGPNTVIGAAGFVWQTRPPGQPVNPSQPLYPGQPPYAEYPPYPTQPSYPGYPPNPSQPLYPGYPSYPGHAPAQMQMQVRAPRSNAPVIVLLTLILLALVGGGGYYLYRTHQTSTSATSGSVAGTWDAVLTHTLTTSNGNAENDKMTLQQSGSQITGEFTNAQGGGLAITGNVSGNDVVMNANVDVQGESCTVHLTGTLTDANHMNGDWNAECTGSSSGTDGGTWSATRTSS